MLNGSACKANSISPDTKQGIPVRSCVCASPWNTVKIQFSDMSVELNSQLGHMLN